VTTKATKKSSSFHHASISSAAPLTSCSLLSSSPPPQSSTGLTILSRRSLSSDNYNNNNNSSNKDDQNFFLQNDEDSLPAPPSYVRDAITGKWTDKTQAELSIEEKKLLKLDEQSKTEALVDRLEQQWDKAKASASGSDDNDGFGTLHEEQRRVAHRIQEEQLALGTIGRQPSLNTTNTTSSSSKSDQPLSEREFQALKSYAEQEHNIHPKDFARLNTNDPDLLPHDNNINNHNNVSSGRYTEGNSDSKQFFDADMDLAHLNPQLNKLAFRNDNVDHYDPFADLLPSDFNPTRKVNRKHAKLLPSSLLHHNNLSLLRRYTTPGGKIMNRVQSRLGAKDQRKIAKLVKRARHLGLIPHIGQWKFEDHGNVHERGLEDADKDNVGGAEGKRDWEEELEQRGLWPLADENELMKRFYDVDGILEHLAGPVDGKKRKELEELLGGGVGEVGEVGSK